jgi:hypothetical protein
MCIGTASHGVEVTEEHINKRRHSTCALGRHPAPPAGGPARWHVSSSSYDSTLAH